MKVPEAIYSTVANKCPRCHRGHLFVNNNPYSLENGLTMQERCNVCDLKYERENGFFYGAMYVSYALVAGLFITLFVLDQLVFNMETGAFLGVFIGMVFALFPVTYRWGRTLWLNFFVKYDKKYTHTHAPIVQLAHHEQKK